MDHDTVAQDLVAIIAQLDRCFTALSNQSGKAGQALTDNEWLMGIRSRLGIPGGRDEHLMYRFVDAGYAPYCTRNPLRRGQVEGRDYFLI